MFSHNGKARDAESPSKKSGRWSLSGLKGKISRSRSPSPLPSKVSSTHSEKEPISSTTSTPVSTQNKASLMVIPKLVLPPSPTGSPNRSVSLWEKAIKDLPKEDQNAFDFYGQDGLKVLDAVLKATEEKREICHEKMWKFSWKGKEIVLRDVAEKTITWVNKFKSLGNMVAQTDPVNLAVWAPIKYILEIAVKENQKMGEMLVGIELITNLMGRCAVYEELYLGSSLETADRVEAQLISLYAKILTYLVTAKAYYSQNTAARIAWGFLDESGPLEDLKKIQEQAEQVRADTDLAEAKGQINRNEELKGLLKEFNIPIVRIKHGLTVLHDGLEATVREKILNWVSKVAYTSYHRTAREGRSKGTCKWLLERPEFHEWQISSASSILWLRGDPGAGKTTLTSMVVDSVLENPDNHEALAYFYCKSGEARLSDPVEVLKSLVRQLSFENTGLDLRGPVLAAYKKATEKANDDSLGAQQCVSLIVELIDLNLHTTIVIDALDECDGATRNILFRGLREILNTSSSLVKIFISSRNDDDIKLAFESNPNISINKEDNSTDIELYVHTEVERCIKEKRLLRGMVKGPLKELVISTLLKKASGMFLWAELQIKGLCALKFEEDIEAELGDLPLDLEKTYEEIYRRILAEKGSGPKLAKRALMWVFCSCRPLSPEELTAMVSLDTSGMTTEVDVLLQICHNLLKVDEQLNLIRFFHLSVEEFLQKENYFTTLEANTMASEFCLSRLNSLPGPTASQFIEPYVNLHWHTHAQQCFGKDADQKTSSDTWGLLKIFFGSFSRPSNAYINWLLTLPTYLNKYDNLHDQLKTGKGATLSPSLAAARFGFGERIRDLWDENKWALNLANENDETLLYVAASYGHGSVVQILLEKGAKVNAQGGTFGNALQAAASAGNEKVVQILLDGGAEVNAQGGYFGNALQAAAFEGNEKVVQILLDSRAEANAQGGGYGNALQAAAYKGNEKVVQILLEQGAEVNAQGGYFGNALQAAAYEGNEKVVQILLESGAETNAEGDEYGNALQAAAYRGHEKVVQILLEGGAEVNAQGGLYGNALQAAASTGNKKIVQILLEGGAEFNAQGGYYGNALQAAAFEGNEKLVQILLDGGAEVNAQGGYFGNALQAAAFEGNEKVVQILLDSGAEVNAQGGYYGNALQAAAYRGHEKVVQILLEKGVEVNAQGGYFGNALQAAAYEGTENVVKILLESRAEVNAQGGKYGNALQAAASAGNEKVVQILLAKKAIQDIKPSSNDK